MGLYTKKPLYGGFYTNASARFATAEYFRSATRPGLRFFECEARRSRLAVCH